MTYKVNCTYQSLMPIFELKLAFNPDNPNVHSKRQIDRMAEILAAQGARSPAIIDADSGLLIVGHGRIQAAEKLNWTHYPVDVQNFESPELAYAHMVADNGMGDWSEMDRGKINQKLEGLGPDLNLNLLGLDGFALDLAEKEPEEKPQRLSFKVTPEQKDTIERALEAAKEEGFYEAEEKPTPGDYLARLCETYLTLKGN